ncbi:MAG: outer membrane protein Omp31 [Devosia sp.]|uniref:outer membrane protein n=1 Tax=Devosia sp. TaxID=1871048 RepID=UPI002636E3FB|nr:outer membrane beta-barrel protein [Devosia sp.]MDB5540201.1 outer membrane protein Omp31 [Devosia sp.]
MKRLVFAVAAITAAIASMPVDAADFAAPEEADAALPSSYSWSGLYVGGTVGTVSATADVSNVLFEGFDPGIPNFTVEFSGMLAGVTVGANHQWDNVVAGIEADYSWSNAEGSYTDPVFNFTVSTRLQSLASLRGRLGFAVNQLLFYGTAGAAYGTLEGELQDVYQAGTVVTTDTQSMLGWTAGVGAEIAVADNVTLKGEALYYDLGTTTYEFFEGPGRINPVSSDAAVTGWLGWVGANFNF